MMELCHNVIRDHLGQSIELLSAVKADVTLHQTLIDAAMATAQSLKTGHKLLVAGNGGSAADAQHLVAEFVSRLVNDRPAMRAIALTTDSSVLTAIGNDYGYDRVFERQVEALGEPGDFFLGISTSGNSPNILRAMETSLKLGLLTIGFTGMSGGKLPPLCTYCIRIPSATTMRIQEMHLALEHIFCTLVEQAYFRPGTFRVPAGCISVHQPWKAARSAPVVAHR